MPSQRSLIRKAVVEKLKGKTIAQNDVFENRVKPLFPKEPPAILVYAIEEDVSEFTQAPKKYQRALSLVIECAVNSRFEDVEDQIDELTEQVEYVMNQDHFINDLCQDSTLKSARFAYQPGGHDLVSCVLTYEVIYYTDAIPDLIDVPALSSIDADIEVPNSDAKTEVRLELPE